MRHPHELGAERADLDGAVLRHSLAQLGRVQEPVLVELRLEQSERQPRPPDLGHADVAHQVRQRADVVLVRMREQHRAHLLRAVAQVREVREDEIDAEMLVARERQAGVDDHDLVVELVDRQVLSDLSEAPERDDPQCGHGRKYHLRERQKGEQDSPVRGREAAAVISIL